MIRRNTWVLLGIFALLLVVTFVLQQTGAGEPDAADVPTSAVRPNLFTFTADQVVSVRIENLDGVAVEAEKSGDVWLLVQPEAAADLVDQSRIEGLLGQLAAVRVLTDSAINGSLSALQLQYPPHQLTVRLSSGEERVLAIGESSIANTGYYVSLDGAAPQLVSKSALDSFIELLDSPPLLPTPVPTPENTLEPEATP